MALADLRPSADGSAVRTSLVAGHLQAASVLIAYVAAPWDRQTERLFQNARLGRGHITSCSHVEFEAFDVEAEVVDGGAVECDEQSVQRKARHHTGAGPSRLRQVLAVSRF